MARRRYCCYYCWFMLISLGAGNTFCSPPPRWGSKTLSCLAASCFFFSSFLVFPWHHTKSACKSQWKHLSIYLYYRIHLSVVASSLAMTPHKLHRGKKGECNCEKKKKAKNAYRKIFIHCLEATFRGGRAEMLMQILRICACSSWELDRLSISNWQ